MSGLRQPPSAASRSPCSRAASKEPRGESKSEYDSKSESRKCVLFLARALCSWTCIYIGPYDLDFRPQTQIKPTYEPRIFGSCVSPSRVIVRIRVTESNQTVRDNLKARKAMQHSADDFNSLFSY